MKNERGRVSNAAIVRQAYAAGVPRGEIPGLTPRQAASTISSLRGAGEATYDRKTATSSEEKTPRERRSSTGEDTVAPVEQELVLSGFVLRGASETDIASITGEQNDSKAVEDEKKGIAFARILAAKQIFGEDLSMWRLLGALYRKEGKLIPPNFFDRLRLEAFLSARLAYERDRNTEPLREYMEAGERVGRVWFEERLSGEEDFIATFLSTIHYYNGHDERGFYRVDKDGKRWYQPIGSDENGGLKFDNLSETRKRAIARES